MGNKIPLARGYDGLAIALAQLSPPPAALCAQLLAVSDRLRIETYAPRWSDEQALYAQTIESLRQALGPRQWAACQALGQAMALPEALLVALQTPIPEMPQPGAAVLPTEGWRLLTRREQEIAHLVALGKSNEYIAAQQVVVVKTVEKHITSILRKLQLTNRTELAAWVINQKIR